MTEGDLLERLRDWQTSGVLRRFDHCYATARSDLRRTACAAGYAEKRWRRQGVGEERSRSVTHCYERPRMDIFPFRLYAMIHTSEWFLKTQQLYERLDT